MDYSEKYNKTIKISDATAAQELAIEVVMKEGELRYRDYLVSVLEETKSIMQASGGEVNLPINALINIVRSEPSNAK